MSRENSPTNSRRKRKASTSISSDSSLSEVESEPALSPQKYENIEDEESKARCNLAELSECDSPPSEDIREAQSSPLQLQYEDPIFNEDLPDMNVYSPCSGSSASEHTLNENLMGGDIAPDIDNEESETAESNISEGTDEESSLGELEENEDEVPIVEEVDAPIYRGANITIMQSLLAILAFSCTHNLSAACLSDLLCLISLHLASQPLVLKSLYRFRKHFDYLKTPPKYHYYCTVCFADLLSSTDLCQSCPEGTKKSFFLSMSIVEQVKNFYNREGFSRLIKFPTNRQKKRNENYEDIYDGKVYKDHLDKCNRRLEMGATVDDFLTFTWNSDGVPIFKSSKYSVWPFYLVINELPYNERYKEEDMILGGLWFGEQKPAVNLFLSKLSPDVDMLREGIQVHSLDNPPRNVQAEILCGVCDLPARAAFLNMIMYNGYHSCCKCEIEGERSERIGNCVVFPFDGRPAPLRTQDHIRVCTEEALRTRETKCGIKGTTMLSLLVQCCFLTTAIDVMHCAYLGVAKKLMTLWFHIDFHAEAFSLRMHIDVVSAFICSLTPPSFIKRLPRSIVDHLSYWKASEFKAWLLYYSVPILHEIMSAEYFNHHLLLVCALFLLNQDSISEGDIETAASLLHEYLLKFESLYGLRHMTMNFHSLQHLPDCVRQFGPLWAVSCFRFEDLNGKLKKHVHGTRYAETQICSYVSTVVNLTSAVHDLREGPVKTFCEQLLSSKKISTNERISDGVYSIGKYKKNDNELLPQITECLIELNKNGNVSLFSSLLKGRVVFRAVGYSRSKKTLSTCADFRHNNSDHLGTIKAFFKLTQCECPEVCDCEGEFFALLTILDRQEHFCTRYPQVQFRFISKCTETSSVVAVNVGSLTKLNVVVTVAEKMYVSKPVNSVELE